MEGRQSRITTHAYKYNNINSKNVIPMAQSSLPAPDARKTLKLIQSSPVQSELPAMRGAPRVRRFFREMEHFGKVLGSSGCKSAGELARGNAAFGEYLGVLSGEYSRNLWNRRVMVSSGCNFLPGGEAAPFERPESKSPHMRSDVHGYLSFVEKAMRALTFGKLGCPKKLVARAERACGEWRKISDSARL